MLGLEAITWNDALEEKGAWDTMVWMATLIGLAGFLNSLGLIPWFAKNIAGMISGMSWVWALLILLILYMYSHYAFASLSAHITALYPAFAPVAVAAGAPPYLVALSLAFVSSLCASLTHYSTGPAPVYFGPGYVSQGRWWKNGFIIGTTNLIIFLVIGGLWWKVIGLW